MWQVALTVILAFGEPGSLLDSLEDLDSRVVPDAPAPQFAQPENDVGEFRHGRPVRVDLALAARKSGLSGRESVTFQGVRLGRSWRGGPDSVTAWRMAAQGPRIALGLRPAVGLTLRRGSRTVTESGRKRQETTWSPAPVAALERPEAGFTLRGLKPAGSRDALQLRSWTARVGLAAAPTGELRLTRSRTSTPSTTFAWRRAPARADEVALTGRLTAAAGRLRFRRRRGRYALDVSMRATPAPNSALPRTRAAETGRLRAVVSGPRWQAGAQVAVGFRSRGLEAFATRTLHVRGGALSARSTLAWGSMREVRWHAAFTPRARLGPLGFTAGAGVAYRPTLTRHRLKSEWTGAAQLRRGFVTARLGWELVPERGTLQIAPGIAGHVAVKGGPVALDLRYRPGGGGLSGTASAGWGH